MATARLLALSGAGACGSGAGWACGSGTCGFGASETGSGACGLGAGGGWACGSGTCGFGAGGTSGAGWACGSGTCVCFGAGWETSVGLGFGASVVSGSGSAPASSIELLEPDVDFSCQASHERIMCFKLNMSQNVLEGHHNATQFHQSFRGGNLPNAWYKELRTESSIVKGLGMRLKMVEVWHLFGAVGGHKTIGPKSNHILDNPFKYCNEPIQPKALGSWRVCQPYS